MVSLDTILRKIFYLGFQFSSYGNNYLFLKHIKSILFLMCDED